MFFRPWPGLAVNQQPAPWSKNGETHDASAHRRQPTPRETRPGRQGVIASPRFPKRDLLGRPHKRRRGRQALNQRAALSPDTQGGAGAANLGAPGIYGAREPQPTESDETGKRAKPPHSVGNRLGRRWAPNWGLCKFTVIGPRPNTVKRPIGRTSETAAWRQAANCWMPRRISETPDGGVHKRNAVSCIKAARRHFLELILIRISAMGKFSYSVFCGISP